MSYPPKGEAIGNFIVWMPASGQPPQGCHVYVLELDQAEICARKCLGLRTTPRSINDKLVVRYWNIARRVFYGTTDKSSGRIAEKKAFEVIAELRRGIKIKPDYIKKGRERDYGKDGEAEESVSQDRQGALDVGSR